jgi:hypothetical protein
MKDWEKSLDQIAKAGYSYGYVPFIDLATGQKFFLVDAIKGDGPRIAVIESNMTEAVNELVRLMNLRSANILCS